MVKTRIKRDWVKYNDSLIKRGEYYVNPRFLDTWLEETKLSNQNKVGQPYLYPESMIIFLSALWCKGFSLRDLQGVIKALSKRLGPFPVISFSQIRRRILKLKLEFKPTGDDLIVACDGTGLKITNRGEWMRQKWAIRRGWIKVVIMGTTKGDIIDIRIGNEDLDEKKSTRGMIRKNKKHIKKILLDGLHDCNQTFDLCYQESIDVGIKIRENANKKGLTPRAREVKLYKKLGYEKWRDKKDYGQRWPASENIFGNVKGIFGEEIKSHKKRNIYHEAKLKFWTYQQLKQIV